LFKIYGGMGLENIENRLNKLQEHKFFHHAIEYLRSEFPDKANSHSDVELSDMVKVGCTKACKYGLDSEYAAMAFVDLLWRFDVDFNAENKNRWALEVLEDNSLTPELKLSTLRNAYAVYRVVGCEYGVE